jgi:hypothetical protein
MQEKRVTKILRSRPTLNEPARDSIMRISRKHLKRLWRNHREGYVFLAVHNPRTDQWIERAFALPYSLREVVEFQSKYDPEEFDCYYCASAFSQPKRLARFALPTPYAWCDIDEADPLQFEPQPTILIRTSRGRYQGIWQFEKPLDPKSAEQYSRELAYEWGGDRGGWSITKMMRLPGTLNHKPAYDRPQVIIEWDDERIFIDAPNIRASRLNLISDQEINPHRYDRESVIKKYKRRLPPSRKRLMVDTAVRSKDRSRIIFMIVAALHEAGAYPDEIGAVLWCSPYFISKHGHDVKKLTLEIRRITSKLESSK